MNKKRVAINMTAQLLAFAVNMLLGFILVPVIDSMIPNAYGFTDIANKFVQAAQIVVSALNTMASRFITIHIHRNDREEANQYFSSVFFANVLMAVVFMVPALFVVVYLGHIFQVPPEASLPDIQMLFFFIFVNFLISIMTSVFGVAPYSKDRLELSSIATILGEVVRLAVLFVSYFFFRPYLWYVGCASVASTVIQAAANLIFTRRLLPDMEVKRSYFRWSKVKELVSLGAWNSVTRLGQLLLDGLSTSIANIMISAAAMTTISISTQVPTVISNLMGTIAGVFNPQMTIAYAKEDKEQLLEIIASDYDFYYQYSHCLYDGLWKGFFSALDWENPGSGTAVYSGHAECGNFICQCQYSGALSCVLDYKAGKAEFRGDSRQRDFDYGYGISSFGDYQAWDLCHRRCEYLLWYSEESGIYAYLRGPVPEGEVVYLLWGYFVGAYVHWGYLPDDTSVSAVD